jgi:hypothetical protein
MRVNLTERDKVTFMRANEQFASMFDGTYDFAVIHDPQPAAMRMLLPNAGGHWVWRCHIDLTTADDATWQFLRPAVGRYDAAIFTLPEYVKPDIGVAMVAYVPPSIDPMSPKNVGLDPHLVDEVVHRFGLDPDIVTCAKGITSGYLPMGAVLAAPTVAEPFWAPGAGVWRHGYTYSGHATVAAAALANLDIMEREGLPARALALESKLLDALSPLADHELVEEVRGGVGVLAAVNLRQDLVAEDPMLPARAGAAIRAAGVIVRPLVAGAIAVSPPLVVDDGDLAELAGGFRAGLDAVG